jgi:hypothetical protein
MPSPKSKVEFSGGCICYLESKLEFQISLNSRFGIAQRIDNEVSFPMRLSFSERTVANL